MTLHKFTPTRLAVAICGSLICLSSSAIAAEGDKISELENRLNTLEMELIEARDASKSLDRLKFDPETPSPEFTSKDGKSTMQFTGRIQLDYVNADPFYVGNKREYAEGINEVSFRRVRFGVEGYFSNIWKYSLELDYDGVSAVEVKDANVSYRGWDNSELKLGFQKFGFGLEATGSSTQLAFLERASTDVFSPDRAIGASWLYYGDNYNFTLGYGTTALMTVNDDDEDINQKRDVFNTRFTVAAINTNEHLLHLGLSGLYTKNNSEISEIRYRARPNTNATSRIIDTGKFNTESMQHYGIEAAYQYNNFLVQSEYMIANTDDIFVKDKNYGSLSVNSGYLQAMYAITGEKWSYNAKKGTFKTLDPEHAISAGGYGAWELAARIDISDFDDTDASIYGGKKVDYVLGLNWYLENSLKAQFNFVHTKADYENSFKTVDGISVFEQDGNVVQARLQFDF